MNQDELIERSSGSVFRSIMILTMLPKMMNGYNLGNPNVQKFIKSTGLHFDVIVAEEFFADSFLMFSYKFKAPVVTICKFNFSRIYATSSLKSYYVWNRSLW